MWKIYGIPNLFLLISVSLTVSLPTSLSLSRSLGVADAVCMWFNGFVLLLLLFNFYIVSLFNTFREFLFQHSWKYDTVVYWATERKRKSTTPRVNVCRACNEEKSGKLMHAINQPYTSIQTTIFFPSNSTRQIHRLPFQETRKKKMEEKKRNWNASK